MTRVLVFEYVTGGGFVGEALPVSLLHEGALMRQALLRDLADMADLSLWVLQDARLNLECTVGQVLWLEAEHDLRAFLSAMQADYDAVWLIAPETDGILAAWCDFFQTQGKRLYNVAAEAVRICQDKYQTFRVLSNAGVACVPTVYFQAGRALAKNTVIKANQSAGCDEVFLYQGRLPHLQADKDYICQPYLEGEALSFSCVFQKGKAFFICCNRQVIDINAGVFNLKACVVNVYPEKRTVYQALCQKIAAAIPNLNGYVGIDLMFTSAGEGLVLEINPRLTSSYAGIYSALGLNVAEQVMTLAAGAAVDLKVKEGKAVRVTM